jgi:hypothetical protein
MKTGYCSCSTMVPDLIRVQNSHVVQSSNLSTTSRATPKSAETFLLDLSFAQTVNSRLSAHECLQADVNEMLEGRMNKLALLWPAAVGPAMRTGEQECLGGRSEMFLFAEFV